MATKTGTQIETELDYLLYESTVDDAPWTENAKRAAINRAIRTSWPHFKLPKYDDTTVTLADGTYVYSLATITDIEDMGGWAISEVFVEPNSTDLDWLRLRRVLQGKNATTWRLYVPPGIAAAYNGKKLRVCYYARPVEISTWASDTLDTRFVNYVLHKAAVYLIRLLMQGGSDFNVDVYPQLLKDYEVEAANELHNNTVYVTQYVGLRSDV